VKLLEFVRALPEGYAYAPIYRKGQVLPEGQVSKGKTPLGRAHHQIMGPADVALQLERHPEVYGAVGVFTGPRSKGLVILDVDANLSKLQRKWGESLEGAPCVTSTKANAAKFLFRVPEEHWKEVKGVSLAATGAGYEVLWGRQGLLYGAYPGSSDGKAPEGTYGLVGDLEAIPEAPAWLIAEMRDAAAQSEPVGKGLLKNRKALDFSDRTEDEVAEIVQDCLRVIPHLGQGSRDQWVQIGMAIHDALPNELGLTLWSAWSSEDPEYADEWREGNPCEATWASFKRGGGIRFNSLIWMADQQDPLRRRFSDTSRDAVEKAEAATVTVKQAVLTFEEIIKRGMAIYEGDDVARMNYELHALAMEARYKDQSGVEKLLLDHMTQSQQGDGYTMDQRRGKRRDYLIPGLLPCPYTVLFYGDKGCGKSATAFALIKHVVDGIPFQLKDQLVPVQQGKAIYFSADMSEQDFEEEYELHEIRNEKAIRYEPGFNLYRKMQFVKLMNEVQPAIVCIDSLSSCSGAKAADENKAEFAQPLYWLNTNNGILWPACAIIVLHHTAKSGGARGSSAIGAAVAEMWLIEKPAPNAGLSNDQRLITVGKSRIGREGERLIQTQHEDLTVSIVEARRPEEAQTRAGTLAERIMNRLQTSKVPLSRKDLNADPVVGGSVAAIKKTLQRLENRGVLEVDERTTGSGGSGEKFYSALRGGSLFGGTWGQNPCNDSVYQGDSPSENQGCPPPVEGPHGSLLQNAATKGDNLATQEICPPEESSGEAGFDPAGTESSCSREGLDREATELGQMMAAAEQLWDR